MIRVERCSPNGWDIQVRFEDIEKEFALVAAVVLKAIPLERALELVRQAAEHTEECFSMDDEQSKKFHLRLFHLLEINNMSINDLIKAENIPQEDVRDIKCGAIPSLETVRKIAKRFGVSEIYLFGVENETDQGTD